MLAAYKDVSHLFPSLDGELAAYRGCDGQAGDDARRMEGAEIPVDRFLVE